jgi:DNA (cytosine-5)-methyltransferase 1
VTAQPTVISLYSGAGGIDYGFEAAGFDIRVVLDLDHDSCETLRANRGARDDSHHHWQVLEGPITSFETTKILKAARLKKSEPDVLIAGPPCQPFSKSGYWARGESARLDDPRAHTLEEFLRVLEEARPRAFLLENVHGIAYSSKDEGCRYLVDEIRKINRRAGTKYQPISKVLNAASYGVPQLRERFFLVGARDGRTFLFPNETHAATPCEGMARYRTAWDAIGDLEVTNPHDQDLRVRGKWAELLPSIPEGENYLWHTARGGGVPLFGWRTRFWNFLLKLAKDRPSGTVQAQPGPAVGPFHWKSRRLSIKELCRIQTFPDDVTIIGGRTSAQRQVGNAVPSLLAEVLARAIADQLLDVEVADKLKLSPPDRGTVPAPEKCSRVPAKFLTLRADHRPHPGTGKGPGALRRTGTSGF